MGTAARPEWVSWLAKGVVICIILWLYVQLRRHQSHQNRSQGGSGPRPGPPPGESPRPLPGPRPADDVGGTTAPGGSAAEFYLSLIRKSLDTRYGGVEWFAHGGAGVVFKAQDLREGRLVAIKMLSPLLADDERARARFEREAEILSRLDHPGVVKVFDLSRGRPPYFVMEWVEGESLARRVTRQGPMPWKEAIPILRSAARALGAAHTIGLLHRDVKPDNLLLAAGGQVKWIDFGLAHVETLSKLTQTGEVMGTPVAMAPEQIQGERALPATDVYGLGVTAFFLLTGVYPFSGNVVFGHLNTPPPDLAAEVAGLPVEVGAVVSRCLAKDPGERYADGEALAQALEAARGSETNVGWSEA